MWCGERESGGEQWDNQIIMEETESQNGMVQNRCETKSAIYQSNNLMIYLVGIVDFNL